MPLTTRQKLYVLGLQGVGPLVLDGAVNGLIAWGIYSTSNHPISLWSMPLPLSGDLFVTTVVQSILTWLLVGVFVRNDMRRGTVTPIFNKHAGNCNYLRSNMKQFPISCGCPCAAISKSVIIYTGLGIAIFVIPSFIALAVIQMIDSGISDKLDYVVIIYVKALFGGLMGLLMTPIAAVCALSAETAGTRNFIVKDYEVWHLK